MKKSLQKLLEAEHVHVGANHLKKQEWLHTGSLLLDYAVGGGWPRGHTIEIFGAPSSGKSILSLVAEAHCTQQGLYVIHIDGEDNYSSVELNQWRLSFGVDMDYVITLEPQAAEDIINLSNRLLKELGPDCGLLVCDSVGSLKSGRDLDKDTGQHTVGGNAKLLWDWTDRLPQFNTHAAVLLLNHEIDKIGMYTGGTTTRGGRGPKYNSKVRVQVKGKAVAPADSDLSSATHLDMSCFVMKNKVAPPNRTAKILFDLATKQFDLADELVRLAEEKDIIKVTPPWFAFDLTGKEQKIQGRANVREFFKDEKNFELLKAKVQAATA